MEVTRWVAPFEVKRPGKPKSWLYGKVLMFLGYWEMGVSKNKGTPKSSILIGFSSINHPFWGTLIFGNTQMDEKWQTSRICLADFFGFVERIEGFWWSSFWRIVVGFCCSWGLEPPWQRPDDCLSWSFAFHPGWGSRGGGDILHGEGQNSLRADLGPQGLSEIWGGGKGWSKGLEIGWYGGT